MMAKPTINDVARLAGVSKKTVSRVINNSPLLSQATREKVEKVISEIGYVPDPQARALALRRNFLIALVYDGSADFLLPAAQQGVLEAIAGTEYALIVHPVDQNAGEVETEFRRFLEFQRPSGVVLLPPLSERAEIIGLCRELGCNHVRLGASPTGDEKEVPAAGDRAATAKLVADLIAQGHERIGLIAGPEDLYSARERELGYLDAIADHDLDRGPSLIASGDNSFESGLAAGRLLLEVSPRPTAIIACSDEMAAGVLHAAGELGLAVPDKLSVVGYGDTAIAVRLWPPLTTVRVPFAEMAKAAAGSLVRPDAGGEAQSDFYPVIVERSSTARAPG
ncbi:MAG: LacI family DNA-binding transcriptional regulator [Novosphingobium sp.]|nr:LacI family DNA-binding transcriptional regulator [Novosphingobium sp.]MCP5401096.1 LacI family DNA-binding transcriptional regulator [Novosphingobium sp.]